MGNTSANENVQFVLDDIKVEQKVRKWKKRLNDLPPSIHVFFTNRVNWVLTSISLFVNERFQSLPPVIEHVIEGLEVEGRLRKYKDAR